MNKVFFIKKNECYISVQQVTRHAPPARAHTSRRRDREKTARKLHASTHHERLLTTVRVYDSSSAMKLGAASMKPKATCLHYISLHDHDVVGVPLPSYYTSNRVRTESLLRRKCQINKESERKPAANTLSRITSRPHSSSQPSMCHAQ